MPIPDFQTIMLPLLKFTSDGKQHAIRDTIDALAKEFHLSQKEKEEHLPSGTQAVFYNRVVWARIYLTRAGLLMAPARGVFVIADSGRKVLESNPPRIDMRYLQKFPAYVEWRKTFKADDTQVEESQNTPAEELEKGFHKLREALAAELLDKVKVSNLRFLKSLLSNCS